MPDTTEAVRMEMTATINGTAVARSQEGLTADDQRKILEKQYGQVWDTDQLCEDFEVTGFGAPFCAVRRKSDGQRGSLEFQHHPRFYYNFVSG